MRRLYAWSDSVGSLESGSSVEWPHALLALSASFAPNAGIAPAGALPHVWGAELARAGTVGTAHSLALSLIRPLPRIALQAAVAAPLSCSFDPAAQALLTVRDALFARSVC